MRKIIIPAGKALFIKSGNYRYAGPMELPESRLIGKRIPEVFEDGTKWEWSEDKPKVDKPIKVDKPKVEKPEVEKPKRVEKNDEPKSDESTPTTKRPSQRSKNKKKDSGTP